MRVVQRIVQSVFVAVVASVLTVGMASAQTSSSTNYRVNEVMFGAGGNVDSTSANYRAHSAAGSLGVGDTSSANYDGVAGFITPNEPFLEMLVTGASVDFGTLSDTTTSYGAAQAGACNCSFTVRTYLSSEYTVITASQPPTNESGVSLTAKSVLGVPSSNQNVEEFGINVVDNATPNMGANPVNVPSNAYADGQAATDYDTPDQFKYAAGDVIARSQATVGNQAVGQTNYTISYIAKRKPMTPAGVYTLKHVLVAVPTY